MYCILLLLDLAQNFSLYSNIILPLLLFNILSINYYPIFLPFANMILILY